MSSADATSAATSDTARVSAEQTVSEQTFNEAQALAAIINSSQDAVIAKDLDGLITSWNDGATHVYGYQRTEMVGHSFERLVPPDTLAEERARQARAGGGRAESGFHAMRYRSDGQSLGVVMSMSPIVDKSGVVAGVASISRPASMTERDNLRFETLLEAARDASVCVDARGVIITANAQVTDMLGYERHELLGSLVKILLPENSRHRHAGMRATYMHDTTARPMGLGRPCSGATETALCSPSPAVWPHRVWA